MPLQKFSHASSSRQNFLFPLRAIFAACIYKRQIFKSVLLYGNSYFIENHSISKSSRQHKCIIVILRFLNKNDLNNYSSVNKSHWYFIYQAAALKFEVCQNLLELLHLPHVLNLKREWLAKQSHQNEWHQNYLTFHPYEDC